MARVNSKQDQNGAYSLLGVTSLGETRAVQTDEDGNLCVVVNDIILTSPDGTKFKVVVNNSGTLSTEEV
jgi:hypothetical protein